MNKDLNKINKELLKFFEKYKDNIPEKDLENFLIEILHLFLIEIRFMMYLSLMIDLV